MKRLVHNGILIATYVWKGFHITAKSKEIELNPEQEEMAVAWVKKLGTEYAEDRIFVRNFFKDFCEALALGGNFGPEDFDFTIIRDYVEKEKALRLSMPKEESKKLAERRKDLREMNREKYGYAIVDDIKTEISNYVAEPSSIFMGRGAHPRRGQWKAGPKEEDIVLNLSPEASRPAGKWKGIVWDPESMWIAKWTDKLSGKMKYVWLADSASLKQNVEIKKFDKANELQSRIDDVRAHINEGLRSTDVLRRKVATVCYLIDELKLRVGDEKDKDEADTVGAITLRPEHIEIHEDGLVTFDFLGKDSIRWHREVRLPQSIIDNIRGFVVEAKSPLFKGVRSANVTQFLDEVLPGLTAKVFRTYHASKLVRDYLSKANVSKNDLEYVKKHVATMANLGAAIACNHKKKVPKNFDISVARKMERLEKLKAKKTPKSREAVKALKLKIQEAKETKEYNLRTSLKSYIDPRAYCSWGNKIDYDWKLYYPKTLQKKFSWVETGNSESKGSDI